VDRFSLVSEEQIKHAMRLLILEEHILVEEAGAVPIASLIKDKDKIKGKNIVLVICGSNISKDALMSVLDA